MNGLTLAYIGDAYYELSVRMYLVEKKLTNVDNLHKTAIRFTSGVSQAKIMNKMIEENLITEEEMDLFRRGRNSSGPGRKNTDPQTYGIATGFEAMLGGLYLTNKNRSDQLIGLAIRYIEKGDFSGKDSE